MTDKIFSQSGLPIKRTIELLPSVFQTDANSKFISGVLDPLVQPGTLDKTVGYVGRRYGKTFNSTDVYLDTDNTLRSRYQLEPGIVIKKNNTVESFYDYIDFKNQLRFFGNEISRDDKITDQDHYSWNPPIQWDKFVNFREYYWIPDGPPPVKILGQSQSIISTYRIRLGDQSSFVFFPDGFKNNPTLTLYRGQTYKFQVNLPENGFVIRTGYDTGSLLYNPDISYTAGQFAVFDGKLWKAKVNIPFTEGSTITEESQDWEYVESAANTSSLDYNIGVTNNGATQGTITFSVPLDSPDVLFYQSFTDPNRFGRFLISNIESNTKIDVEKEILGKETYISSNGISLSNGMMVYFLGEVTPSKYAQDTWLVEGVGTGIRLVRFADLTPPRVSIESPEVLFDNAGFDTDPFDDASLYPGQKDYIVIDRSSQDANPWSRYNRWFHRSVLEFSHAFNGTDFDAPDTARAKRPIIEFSANLQLFNHGSIAKQTVDFIDTFTTDVFSTIEGSQGYVVDGEELFQGARVLFVADTDRMANNKIYEVNFINHSTGSAYRADWSVNSSYRSGETVRFQGQSFTSRIDSPSYLLNIVLSSSLTNRFRVSKNLNIKQDMAIAFSGTVFGNVVPGQQYFVLSVNNDDIDATEFTISVSKRGPTFNLTTGAPGAASMSASVAIHPTTSATWVTSSDRRQISLRKVADSDPILGEGVLIKRGKGNSGLMYHYNGQHWVVSQRKTSVNVSPLFDVFDNDQVSFGDTDRYPVSTFSGSKIVSYKQGNSSIDIELGFGLSYLNIDNVGDITFEFNWDLDTFTYELNRIGITKKVATGFYKFNDNSEFGNCWLSADRRYYQPIIDSKILENDSDEVNFRTIKWESISDDRIFKITLYVNGIKFAAGYERIGGIFKFNSTLSKNSVVSVKIFCDAEPDEGYYEIPIGLEKNPLNADIQTFTLGQAVDHISTAVDVDESFIGVYPGDSNLRDIAGYPVFARRFIKHTGIAPVALTLLCDKQINVIKALEYSTKAYRDYKNTFLQFAETLDYGLNPSEFVDDIIAAMTKVKKETDPFVDSDMIGAGAYSSKNYVVEDTEIKIFALNTKFDLTVNSSLAVYVYVNGDQLVVDRDYTFNSNFGFVELSVNLVEGDRVEIREYVSTAFSYMPPTPTKLGLYKKYLPQKFVDSTYRTPTEVIQGHDGSIVVAYGDYRDDVILELEKRIYNNIKKTYTSEIFDIDSIFGGRYGNAVYNKQELDSVVSRQFRRWAQISRAEFVDNIYFTDADPFTYNYGSAIDTTSSVNLPAWWRGIYTWFYDTDRPHSHPWEMLGFTEKPTWWESQYGPAPYTNNNLILWEDLRDGRIRQGLTAGVHDRYKRPTLMSHLPVDGDGILLDPISSNIATSIPILLEPGYFKFGDISPVESAWRRSSDWPFALIIAASVMRPFEFITENLDKNKLIKNIIGQTICANTGLFYTISDIINSANAIEKSTGILNYVVNYLRGLGLPQTILTDKISGIDINLSTRLSGFVDKSQQKYILDSKNPSSKSSSIFVPPENYDINFNVSVPIATLTYSGVIIEKTTTGFKVFGYDNLDPVFKYWDSYVADSRSITVGGTEAAFTEWVSGKQYANGTIVKNRDLFFRAVITHTSGSNFDPSLWQRLPKLPVTGSIDAQIRTKFNRSSAKILEYGAIFIDPQKLVDFLCGYEAYLVDQGFEFSEYDQTISEPRNWQTSIKEFLYWSRHNWSPGSLISLSPSANGVVLNTPLGVIENLLDGFYDYRILQSDGTVIPVNQINVNRDYQKVTVTTVSSAIGIFLFKAYLVLKEHVTIFSDRTVFNDVLYDKTTGYRQDRIKSRGFRTTDWDGDYTSPGFLYDNVNIQVWQPFVDYKLGDIVAYKSYNWTSLTSQKGVEIFDDSQWTKLDLTPTKQLVSNFDFKTNQFEDYYNSDADGTGSSQRDLARHAIGYQNRDYLQEIAEDQVTQFKLYQGFIREKGTNNAIIKVFDKLSKTPDSSIELNEEWGFRVGKFGGVDQVSYVEFEIDKGDIQINPQPVLITASPEIKTTLDSYIRIDKSKFSYAPVPYTTNINPLVQYTGLSRSAGYVAGYQVDVIIKSKEELETIDINSLAENTHIWVTFDKNSWSVVRFNSTKSLVIKSIEQDPDQVEFVTLNLNRTHNFKVGDYVGLKEISDLTGFYPIVSIKSRSITILQPVTGTEISFDESTVSYNLCTLTPARYANFNSVDQESAAILKNGSKIWIDEVTTNDNKWQVVEKQAQYIGNTIDDYLIIDPVRIGTSVIYADNNKLSIFGVPGSGYVLAASEIRGNLVVKQIVEPSLPFIPFLNNSFGESLAISPDETWLAVGAPRASGVLSRYRGDFTGMKNYSPGDVVLYRGQLWRALQSQISDGSTINLNSENWIPETLIVGNPTGVSGPTNQGAVFMFKREFGQWTVSTPILSPRINAEEFFGSSISLSVVGKKYYMAVSATGTANNTGRVYLFVYENSNWRIINDNNYRGIFDSTESYLTGEVVWFNSQLWTALEDIPDGGSVNVVQWQLTNNTGSFLPTRATYNELTSDNMPDGSTLPIGLIEDSTLIPSYPDAVQLAEMIKPGDRFGHSVSMNRDGSILAISAPDSDGQFFPKYRGLWNSTQAYQTGDVVRFIDDLTQVSSYRRLFDPRSNDDPNTDSSAIYTSIGELPEGDPWETIGDSTSIPSGKVFLYKRDNNGAYKLIQTIAAGSLENINDTGIKENISSGDKFGTSIDFDSSGVTLVITSPTADINFESQGSAYVLRRTNLDSTEFRLKQKLQSFEQYPNEYFGSSISISGRSERIAVGAKNAKYRSSTTYDNATTTFDNTLTVFSEDVGNPGQIYVYEKKDDTYFLVEKLDSDFQDFESFGSAIDMSDTTILVGSPNFKKSIPSIDLIAGRSYSIVEVGNTNWYALGLSTLIIPIPGTQFIATDSGVGSGTVVSDIKTGKVRLFKRSLTTDSWKIISEESESVDLETIRNVSLYDQSKLTNLGAIELVDNRKLKILSAAEQEISFKTIYDPAVYSVGTDNQEVDEDRAWFGENVGKLWWDLSAVKFDYYDQGDLAYKIGHWNKQVYGSSVDIYEWVESDYLPSVWAELARSPGGASREISGIPMFDDDTVYSIKTLFNSVTGQSSGTKYYFWVKNKSVTPRDVIGRRISAADVKNLIEFPESSNISFVAPIAADQFLFWNLESIIDSNKILVNIEYNRDNVIVNLTHNEYQLLTEGVSDSLPTASLEEKWIDSLVGYNISGNKVPDISLPEKQKYGLSFRPRQSMFVDRFSVLGSVIDNINNILSTRAFADIINYTNLNLVDVVPASVLNEYDTVVDQTIDLQNVGTIRVKRPILVPNIVNGEIDTITIVDPGFGYKVTPYIKIVGDGIGAEAVVSIDAQGRIASASVMVKGKRYTSASITIRNFSVLVQQDETINNYWAIYAWDDVRREFIKSKIQSYDTTKYWKYVDWYATGYSSNSRIIVEIDSLYQESTIFASTGDIIRVKEYANGGWALLERTAISAGNISLDYKLVGRQFGTIEIIKESFVPTRGIGLDSFATFDGNFYDIQPTKELRHILQAIRDDVFIEDLRVEWNKLFFTSIRYSFVQTPAVDWAFKTSFLNAIHNVGNLEQKISYKNDNLASYQSYIEEVKPYRTTIREYTSKYKNLDVSQAASTDFDSPPAFSELDGKILPVNESTSYPWKSFFDNQGYSVTSFNVITAGSGYTTPPSVLIEGNGTGAVGKAYISNGRVTGISVVSSGTGYLSAPLVRLVGGNGISQDIARASAVIGNGVIRSFNLGMKFDRISKTGILQQFTESETFIALGFTATFDLKYAPTRDKNKIEILKNGQLVLTNEYNVTLYRTATELGNTLRGKLIFVQPPSTGDVIVVNYEKNDEYLDAVNRVDKYYSPTAGMAGKELPQLMTGIDFGGVQIQGTTFDVTGGWDALPWFTDNWDSVESASDFYYVADGSTTSVELLSVPPAGQYISIYVKRANLTTPQNIDTLGNPLLDPTYVINPATLSNSPVRIDSINFPASGLMPTFIGDGSTKIIEFNNPITDQPYITIEAGDTIIFRPFDSDGSVVINDPNIIDTRLSGGTLSIMGGAYITATGKTAEEIAIDGGKFVEPDHVPATEENVPGQVLESVSIKVYHTRPQGAAPLQSNVYYGSGIEIRFNIGLTVLEANSVKVYVDKEHAEYSIDFVTNDVVFDIAPSIGSIIEIVSIGLGGINLLDYQEFIADGETSLFLTRAVYNQTSSIVVTVDGIETDAFFSNSSEYTDTEDRTIVVISNAPLNGQVVKIVSLGTGLDTDSTGNSIIRVNRQTLTYDGSTTRLQLDKFVNLTRASATSSVLVQVNGFEIAGPDTIVVVYDGSNNVIELGIDPTLPAGTIILNNILVYINNELQPVIVAYTYNNASSLLTVNPEYLNAGDEIKVLVDVSSDYNIVNDDIVISEAYAAIMTAGDVIEVTWFSEYPSFDIISDQYTGGQVKYKLKRPAIDSNFVWVYKNGSRLTKEQDFLIDMSRSEIYLNIETIAADSVKIVEFGNDTWTLPNAYEIFKDMLNIYHFRRYSKNNVKLTKDLNYYDLYIEVSDASSLFVPNAARNIPGVVLINNERIEYLQKTGNILSQLRRGCQGTSIAETYPVGTVIADSSMSETIPYVDQQERYDFVSDGSTLLIGPLDFIPSQGVRSNWYRSSIPSLNGPCDQLEVFVGGTRLRKDPIAVYDETQGAASPSADITIEAEFSVDGDSPYIRLTNPVAPGTRITMIRRLGNTWYNKNISTDAGRSMHRNTNTIVDFILQKSTIMPE